MSLKRDLAAFIQANLAADRGAGPIADDSPLIDSGLIDSMGLMQVMAYVEERTGVRIPDEEVMPDNFQTVTSIESLVRRLQSRGGSASAPPPGDH